MRVAYFSAEFGLAECLSIFADGLGIPAGDHLKSASDLGIPLVAVGLIYQQGYFRQYLNAAGWQQESYEDNDVQNLPITLERQPDGRPISIQVGYEGRNVTPTSVARPGRTNSAVSAGYQPAREPEGRSRYHRCA
jgi:glycogen phosphorylase